MKHKLLVKISSALLIVMLAVAALPVMPAYAAVSRPTDWTSVGSARGTGAALNIAGTYAAAAGTQRYALLAVFVVNTNGNIAPTVSGNWGGVAFSNAGAGTNYIGQYGSGTRRGVYMFGFDEADISARANNNITISSSVTTNTTYMQGYMSTYAGVDQTSPYTFGSGGNNVGSATAQYTAALNTVNGSYGAAVLGVGGNTAGTITNTDNFATPNTAYATNINDVQINTSGNYATLGTKAFTATDNTRPVFTFANNRNILVGVVLAPAATLTAQTISFTSAAPAAAVYAGATYTPTATATSGLPVTITVDAASSTVCSITAGVVSFIGVGTCTLNANQAGNGTYSPAPQVQQSFAVGQATSSVTVICPVVAQPYTGSAQTPCTASYTTSDGLNGPLTPTYSNNTNVGTATANAVYAGDANHAGSNNSATFAISQATSSVTVICPVVAQPYTGSAQTPCTASYTTSDGLSGPLTPTYSNNTNVGTATASATYAGDANHAGNTNSANFTISQATSTVTVTCPAAPLPYTGSAQTPCTASYTTSDGLSGPLTPTYSNNTNAGTATANAVYAGDVNHAGSNNSATFTISQTTSSVTVICPVVAQPYTGSAQTPCTASYTTSDGLSGPLTPTYSNNTNAGTATANAVYAGDVNHAGSNNSATFAISQVTSIVTVTCPVATQPFTGSAQTPCTAEATGVGMTPVDVTASLVYSNNTNLGTATADASWAGDINHTGNTGSGSFVIGQATSTVTVTCPANITYTGLPLTPCTAEATGAGMTPVDVTASLVYSNNTNVGTATADASWAGDANHTGNTGTNTFAITQDAQSITVTNSAPATASNGSTFNVAATASSGLTVSITATGVCTVVDNGNGTADITMTSGTGTCSVFYDQAGDGNYSAATQVQEDVTATEGPAFTSANNTAFDVTFFGTFTITAVGNPQTMTISLAGALPSGVSFVDNGDGSAVLSGTPALGTNGTYPLSLTAANGVAPNGTQNFTLTVKSGPIIGANGINSTPDTGDGSIGENESIIDTLGITQLTVEFSQDVYDPAGDTDQDDVTNPANYVLVRSTSTTFATVSCADGVKTPDVQISVDAVSYNNGGGAGPFVSTLSINGGFPLNVVGFYRLYVCGTTSIVDANNTSLVLAGNGTTPGTDFQRNFRIAMVATGGGGGGGDNSSTSSTVVTNGFLIPVTGFAPDRVTTLPAQPAEAAYTSLGQMTIEIPTLGVKFPIVGAKINNKTWDLTWLKDSVAYLEGSAYPTTAGNTVLTAHVQDANKNLGPFSDIKGMTVGQNIYIHVNGQTYVYQVQESRKISLTGITTMFKHEEDSWITLVTCEDFNAKTGLYSTRRMVRAVLISVIPAVK